MRAEWNEIVDMIVKAAKYEIRVSLPARVMSVDTGAGTVRVKPEMILPRLDPEAEGEALPEILDVPVMFPSSAANEITFSLAAGDRGLLIFADHSLGAWLQTGETTTPTVRDPHGPSGAVFVPGVWPSGQGPAIPASGVVVGVRSGEALEVVGSEVRAGRSASASLALKSDVQAIWNYLDSQFKAAGGHTHVVVGGSTTTITSVAATGTPTGTTVTKGK